MGTECHIVGIRKEILARIGKGVGDRVQVDLAEDPLERRVVLHQALDRLLSANHDLGSRFHRLSYTRQKELNDSVASAKKEETRQRRLGQIVDELARQ
jgi:uncharacterized protein YdeI (YjbR/CyaY-like superfamily)